VGTERYRDVWSICLENVRQKTNDLRTQGHTGIAEILTEAIDPWVQHVNAVLPASTTTDPDEPLDTRDLMIVTGATRATICHWQTNKYIVPADPMPSGLNERGCRTYLWAPAEAEVTRLMVLMVRAGIRPPVAASIARAHAVHGTTRHDLGGGLTLITTTPGGDH
jgi:hypothetical protein